MNIVRRALYVVTLALASVLPASAAETIARHHLISAANPYAAEAGRQMMREGGSAVDAAIAAQLVLTLVEPKSSGIGGGDFMMVYDPKSGKVTSFDGRETAPASATPDMFLDASGKPRDHFAAVPGGLRPACQASSPCSTWRTRNMDACLGQDCSSPQSSSRPMAFRSAASWQRLCVPFRKLAGMPDIKRYFYKPDGTPLAQGDTLKNPELARTLRVIAKGGPKAFYSGAIAQHIVDAVQHAPVNPGGMTLADLSAYHAVNGRQSAVLIAPTVFAR